MNNQIKDELVKAMEQAEKALMRIRECINNHTFTLHDAFGIQRYFQIGELFIQKAESFSKNAP